MNIEVPIVDFPKIHAPFVREKVSRNYYAKDETLVLRDKEDNVVADYSWVFTEPTVAVDKIDGTNVCVHVRGGQVVAVDNRTTRKPIFAVVQTAWEAQMLEGLAYALSRKWLASYIDADLYGELIGPKINGNRHQLKEYVFVPFTWMQRKCVVPEWATLPKTFDAIREFMCCYRSVFNQRLGLPDIRGEGIVVYRENGEMAKIRRDMFDCFEEDKRC